MSTRYYYTWQEFDEDIEKISRWAREKNFSSVYGIPRGGLVVAVVLSHWLDLPLKLRQEEVGPETLMVDDISDSGEALLEFERGRNMRLAVATLFYHKDTKRMPDFFLREKTDWVVFPWETEASSRYDNL